MGAALGGALVAAALLAGLWFAGVCLVRLPGVWRGRTLTWLPISSLRGPRVEHRSFPIFTAWLTVFVVGAALLMAGAAIDVTPLGVVGVLLMMGAMAVLFPLWLLVNAVNRPRLLVPPSRRDEPGWWASWRERRRRRSAGLVPTEHVVEILDVRPDPEDRHPFEPYYVARCRDDGCDWTGDIVDLDAPDALEVVRAEAAGHSATVTGPLRPLG